MQYFIVEESFWELFPECQIAVIVMEGFKNQAEPESPKQQWLEKELEKANQEAKKYLQEDVLSQNPVIAVWRQAFMKFKTKRNARSSIEALLKRVEKGNEVRSINPLVDLYNIISLRYALPAGGEDLSSMQGPLRLRVTEGGDEFFALGEEGRDDTLKGEICYTDDIGAVCRCWNWREGQRTMLKEETTRAIVLLESVDPRRHEVLREAMNVFVEMSKDILGGNVILAEIVDIKHREVSL